MACREKNKYNKKKVGEFKKQGKNVWSAGAMSIKNNCNTRWQGAVFTLSLIMKWAQLERNYIPNRALLLGARKNLKLIFPIRWAGACFESMHFPTLIKTVKAAQYCDKELKGFRSSQKNHKQNKCFCIH